jgi:flagellar protein FlaJ
VKLVPKITRKEKLLVTYVSVALGLVNAVSVLVVTFVLGAELPLPWDTFLILALMIGLFPPAAVNVIDSSWRAAIDKNIPKFLREVAEAGRSGLTLTRAIEVSAQRKYGPLSKELQRVVAQLSWGISLEESLKSFAERADTMLGRRTAQLIIEVSRSGGDVQEVLESINKHINDLYMLERERKSAMRPYLAIVYVAAIIFLATDLLLIKTFFSEIAKLQQLQTEAGTGALLSISLDVPTLVKVLFHTAIIQGFFGGLVAGKMGEGTVGSGLKHCLILIAISFLAFFLLVWR